MPHNEAKEKYNDGLAIDKNTIKSILGVLLGVLVLVGVLTQVVPAGEFALDETGAIIDGTYTPVEDYKIPIWKILASPVMAFTSDNAATGLAILAILILVGGTFLILDRINVLRYIMASIVKKFSHRRYLLIGVMVFAGMFMSSTAGILEESLTLVPIAVAVALAMGWDSFVGLGMSLVSIAFGFTAATFNPFNVITVQKLAGLEAFSGLWLRVVIFAVVFVSLTAYLIFYAKKIEKNPAKSIAYESDKLIREKYSMEKCMPVLDDSKVKKATKVFAVCLCMVLAGIGASFVLSILGNNLGNETLSSIGGVASLGAMAVFFPLGGLLAGKTSGLKGKSLWKTFGEGVMTILPALPLIIFVLAISYILDEGKIMHTLLYFINNLMSGISPFAAILLMFGFIALLEFFVGSGTAKAFLIVPLISMLCDLLGVTRQSMVITFCMADGFTNLLYPTSGIMILAIGMVGVSYKKWLKWSWKLFVLEGIIAVGFMMLAVAINYR